MRNVRINHADARSWPSFIVVMFPRQQSCWRSGKTKLVVLLLVSLLVMQYLVGSSVYNIRIFDTRIFYNQQWLPLDRNRNDGKSNSVSESKSTVQKLSDPAEISEAQSEITQQQSTVNENFSNFNSSSQGNLTTLVAVEVSNKTISAAASYNHSTHGSSSGHSTGSTTSLFSVTEDVISKLKPANLSLPICSVLPPVLVGPIRVWFDKPSFEELKRLHPYLERGGHSKPQECVSRHRVAVIIPYRDRENQLRVFLHNMLDLLHKQQLDFVIYIIEQIQNQTFNRAKLMNIGFAEASKYYDWQCYIFHDVDLLPEDDRNFYSCPEQPRHMSVAVDKFDYKLPYTDIFGGITALTKQQFEKVNGYSNDFWGWGGEDDEMASRVMRYFKVSRFRAEIARYKMMKHVHEESNPVNKCRYSLMYKYKTRMSTDGLSSLKYKVIKRELKDTHTLITVDLLEKEERERLNSEHLC